MPGCLTDELRSSRRGSPSRPRWKGCGIARTLRVAVCRKRPFTTHEDAGKLDAVREVLRAGDITRGAQLATRLYRLTPVDA